MANEQMFYDSANAQQSTESTGMSLREKFNLASMAPMLAGLGLAGEAGIKVLENQPAPTEIRVAGAMFVGGIALNLMTSPRHPRQ